MRDDDAGQPLALFSYETLSVCGGGEDLQTTSLGSVCQLASVQASYLLE